MIVFKNGDTKETFIATGSFIHKIYEENKWVILTNAHNFRQIVEDELCEYHKAIFMWRREGARKLAASFEVSNVELLTENYQDD